MKPEINRPSRSKINWTAVVGGVAAVAAVWGLEIPPAEQAKLVAAIAVLQSTTVWIFRTWFTAPEAER